MSEFWITNTTESLNFVASFVWCHHCHRRIRSDKEAHIIHEHDDKVDYYCIDCWSLPPVNVESHSDMNPNV